VRTDLSAEFAEAATRAQRAHFDQLIAQGVPHSFLWRGPMRFGVAEIVVTGELYEPGPGPSALVIPACPLADLGDDDEDGDLGDLIAWLPSKPGRWWRRVGGLPILGLSHIERAGFFREALSVWSTPLRWLRASGEGVVILSGDANLRFWLGSVPKVIVDRIELGEKIERGFRAPLPALPHIMVRRAAAMGGAA
jgi:hypothetical protein